MPVRLGEAQQGKWRGCSDSSVPSGCAPVDVLPVLEMKWREECEQDWGCSIARVQRSINNTVPVRWPPRPLVVRLDEQALPRVKLGSYSGVWVQHPAMVLSR